MLGLEDCRQWVLLADAANDALGWLQSATRPETALAVVSPRRFVPDYRFRAYRSELAPLELASMDEAQVLAIVSEHDGRLTLNLKAPIVVNVRTRTARQVVVNDDHPLQFVLAVSVVAPEEERIIALSFGRFIRSAAVVPNSTCKPRLRRRRNRREPNFATSCESLPREGAADACTVETTRREHHYR